MEKKYSKDLPNKVERMGGKFVLNYHLQETTEEDILSLWESENIGNPNGIGQPDDYFKEEHKYNFNQLLIPMGSWSYTGIVEAIIRDKYTADEMEAITNNMNIVVSEFFNQLVSGGILSATKYLIESINGENTEAFKEMQEWRAFAKKTAREIFNNANAIG